MFKNQTIRFRILLGYSVPFILIILVWLAVYISLGTYKNAHWQTEQSTATTDKSQAMFLDVSNLQMFTRGYLLLKRDQSTANYNEAKKNVEDISQFLSTFVKDEKQRELLNRIIEKNRQMINLSDGVISLVNQGKTAKAIEKFGKDNFLNLGEEISKLSVEFDVRETALFEAAQKEENASLGNIGTSLIVGVALTLFFSSTIGLLITNGITKHVAGAINAMSSTATEIAATVNQHERTALQQASMVNEISTTIQELGASSTKTSERASSAAEAAQKSLGATGEGAVIVKQAIGGMNTLGAKVGMIADQILKLGEQTAQLGNLANVIKDFSSEINMLALNAAVEAARAGDHGKGFAVVAGEIRKLANESKKSAEQSNVVISDIQKATNTTILRTEEGTKVVEEVTVHVQNVGELFSTLSEGANNVYENAQQVLLNAKQQAMAIGQVVEAMNGLNTGARETAAGIVQTKAGIEQLNNAAVNLKQIL